MNVAAVQQVGGCGDPVVVVRWVVVVLVHIHDIGVAGAASCLVLVLLNSRILDFGFVFVALCGEEDELVTEFPLRGLSLLLLLLLLYYVLRVLPCSCDYACSTTVLSWCWVWIRFAS